MIANSPWIGGSRKTARNMTARQLNGQTVLSGQRAKGMPNPSPEVLVNQTWARLGWPLFRANQGFIRQLWTLVSGFAYSANEWFTTNRETWIAQGMPDPLAPVFLELVEMSRGRISATPFITPPSASEGAGTFTFTMPTTPLDGSQSADDILRVAAYNVTRDTWVQGQQSNRASLGAISFGLPALTQQGDDIVVYTSFIGGETGPFPGEGAMGTNFWTQVLA